MSEQLLRIPEAASRLALKPSTLRKLLCRGELPRVKIGKRAVRLRESDIERLIRLGFEPARAAGRRLRAVGFENADQGDGINELHPGQEMARSLKGLKKVGAS